MPHGGRGGGGEAPPHLAPRQAPLACVALIDFRLQYFEAAYGPPFSLSSIMKPLHYDDCDVGS